MDLSSRQSMFLMQVAHVCLMCGQEPLNSLLMLLPLLLLLLLQNLISVDSQEHDRPVNLIDKNLTVQLLDDS